MNSPMRRDRHYYLATSGVVQALLDTLKLN